MGYNSTIFNAALKIISLATFMWTLCANAQILIRGVVSEAQTNQLISNASIKNLTSLQGTISNDSGFYKINCRVGELIEFSKNGYLSQRFLVESDKLIINVVLQISNNPLDEIVVSASRSDQALKNTSVSMEVIKPYIITNKNPSTLENTLDQIPGVQSVNGQVVIRSGSGWSYGTGTRVMIMVDGMPMISGDAGQVQWSFIPLENIESMEVIKGASSVLFGSSALNGVINIRTAKPKLKAETKVSTFYGFYAKPLTKELDWNNGKPLSTYGVRAFHSQKIGKNSFAINLNAFNDDGYRMSDNDKRIRLGWQYKRDLKKINGFVGLNGNVQSGTSRSFLLWQSNEQAYTALDSSFTNNNTFRLNIDPYFTMEKRGWKHLIQARYLKVSNEISQVNTNADQSNFSDFFFGEYQLTKTFIGIRFTGGVTSSYAISKSPLYQGNQTAENRAAYLQANHKLGKWNLDAGMRYEYYKLNNYKEAKPVVRAGLSRELAKATFFRASFGQGYRFPTIAESYIETSVGPLKIYPNSQLKSESGWNAELGIKQGLKVGKIAAILDVAAFWMHYNNMMEFAFGQWETNSPTFGFGFKSLNVSDAEIKGIDISFAGSRKWKTSELKWLAGYTYAHAISTEPDKVFLIDSLGNKLSYTSTSSDPEGNFLKYRPKHLCRIDVQYELKGWELGLSIRYNSYLQNIDKAFVGFPIVYVVPGIQTVRDKGKNGDYIIDLRFGKSFKQTKVLVLVNNLLNRQYMTRPCDMRPPRSYMLQVNYSF